ncbi:hypothetical protein FDP41_012235 [Naegleria fowleri]|uniref:Uncharacterized protein n=1 Tax=Naegleria fowleri TaxID=5763 RepID=A0A6A5C746_NAEFO|nr:uncharacterized protein FDP41_012235 [Naegleria fowleri]KAF0981578.1 hypothetical protein FDP41_012235 [Naegleria fowleri]CAG4716530.1 unnamed protein product [Naegleria fowleri]
MFFDEDEIENAFFHDTTTNEPHQHSEDMLYSEEEEFAMKIVEEIYRERSLHDQQMMLLQRKRKLSNSNNSGASYKCSVSSSLSSPLVLCDDEKVLLSHLPSRRTHDKVDWKEYCDMTMRQQFWLMGLDEMILWIIFKIKHCIMVLLHRE